MELSFNKSFLLFHKVIKHVLELRNYILGRYGSTFKLLDFCTLPQAVTHTYIITFKNRPPVILEVMQRHFCSFPSLYQGPSKCLRYFDKIPCEIL